DAVGPYVLRELRNRNPKFHPGNRPNLFYPVYVDPSRDDGRGGLAVSLSPRPGYEVQVEPRNRAGDGSVWRWGRPKLKAALVEDDPVRSQVVAKQRRDGGFNVYEKHRKDTAKAKGLWDASAMRTEQGTLDLRAALGRPVFDHPKPVALVQRCVQLGSDPDGIVLDAFAGSGTTAAAVAAANEADAGARACLLAQWPAPVGIEGYETICDVTRARAAGCGGVRSFVLDAPAAGPPAEAARVEAFDPFARALGVGVGLHARVERTQGWTVLRDGNRTFAWSLERAPGSVDALGLPDGATVVVRDDAWTNVERIEAAQRLRVESP
ncbi:MAG: DNA methyltransferase, partial [Myxococcota bacterium]